MVSILMDRRLSEMQITCRRAAKLIHYVILNKQLTMLSMYWCHILEPYDLELETPLGKHLHI